jgi:protein involved in polysaccharide export with SLBB domain
LQSDDQLYVFARNEIRILADTATGRVPRTDNPVVSGINIVGRVTSSTADPTLPPALLPRVSGQPVPPAADGATIPGWKYCAAPSPALYGPSLPPAAQLRSMLAPNALAIGRPGLSSGSLPPLNEMQIQQANQQQALQQQANQLQANQQPAGPNSPSGSAAPITPTYGLLPQYQTAPGSGLDCVPPPVSPEAIALKLGVTTESLLRLAADHIIWIQDRVRDPGPYLAMDGITLTEFIQLAGGTAREANLGSVEVSSKDVDSEAGVARTRRATFQAASADFSRIVLRAADVVRFPAVFSDRLEGSVAISGEVKYPGSFDIVRGERLSDLLRRSGGLTETAFPAGAVFLRQSAAENERLGNEREARALSTQLSTLASSPNPDDRQKVAFVSTLIQDIQNAPALGRISASVDPDILRAHPELDILMEPGDRIVIPPRPSTVTVVGDVLSPGAFQYRPGLAADDYITLAGGPSRGADEARTFIVFPDGTARPLDRAWLSFSKTNIVPLGATIVVPRDLRPFNLPIFLRDSTQIMSQLAISAASLAVVSRR